EPLFGGRLARGLVEPRLEQFPLEIGLGPGGARRLEIAPGPFRRALRLRQRPGALRPSEVREHIGHLALVQRQLVAQRRQLAFEHRHPLAMLGREPPGDRHRLGVADLGRQAAAPLGVGEPLALRRQVALRPRHRVARLLHGQLGLHHRLAHATRQVPHLPRRRRPSERGAQRVPQALEHGPLALANRLRKERREHLLHRARFALGAGGPPALVLLDGLLLAEALTALRAPILVNGHGEFYVMPRPHGGQVDAPPRGVLWAVLVLLPARAAGQATGLVYGTVTDSAGAPLADVTVSAAPAAGP